MSAARNAGIDRLRGLVMVLMVLDHSRAFLGRVGDPLDLVSTTPAWFFTRWITHLCAPTFVLLAGVGAALYARRVSAPVASRFLWTRGLWLILLEVTVVNACWQFGYRSVSLLVIWALGASMVGLALLVRVHRHAPLVAGVVITLGHDLLSGIAPADLGALGVPFGLLFSQVSFELGSLPVGASYAAVPWLGVMALGWAAAPLLVDEQGRLRGRIAWLGLALVGAFLLLRLPGLYGEPQPWALQERGVLWSALSVLDTSKYPPSLQFLLMTLGPALLLLPLLERLRGPLALLLRLFGSVPMFFYLLHIPVVHSLALAWAWVQSGAWSGLGVLAPSLGRAYLGWVLVLALLYLPCRDWADLKRRRRGQRGWGWLRYL